MWSRHWNTADLGAKQELNFHPERSFFKRGKKKSHGQDPGSKKGVAKSECFPWRDARAPALTCVH